MPLRKSTAPEWMSGSKETMGVRPLVPLDEQYIGVAGNQA